MLKMLQPTVEFYERAFGLSRRFLHESGSYAEMETGATALASHKKSFISESLNFVTNRLDRDPAGLEVGLSVTKWKLPSIAPFKLGRRLSSNLLSSLGDKLSRMFAISTAC